MLLRLTLSSRHSDGRTRGVLRSNFTQSKRWLLICGTGQDNAICNIRRDTQDHADPHVEHAEHFFLSNVPQSLQPIEQLRTVPRVAINGRMDVCWQDSFEIVGNATTRDVGNSMDVCIACSLNRRSNRTRIDSSRAQQGVSHTAVQFLNMVRKTQTGMLKDDLSNQTVTI